MMKQPKCEPAPTTKDRWYVVAPTSKDRWYMVPGPHLTMGAGSRWLDETT